MNQKKKIIILGAGFGGLRAALLIAKKIKALKLDQKYEMVLVDRNDFQLFTPSLYEVAAHMEKDASASARSSRPIAPLLKKAPITFINDELESADFTKGDIHLKQQGELKADFVVIALGSEVNYFGIPGLPENSLPLKSFSDAENIRDTISARAKTNPNLRILVGGAGPTGVELASELKYKYPSFDVNIVEAMPTILLGLDPRVADIAVKRLKKLGVGLRLNAKISSVGAGEVGIENSEPIPFDLMIWSGGIKGLDVLGKLPLHAEKGRPIATDGMQCLPGSPNLELASMVFGLGDAVCFHNPKTGKPTPAIAPAAMAQADVVAHNVIEEIKKLENQNYKPKIANYVPKDFPYVIPMGGRWAVAKIGTFIISGWLGHIFKVLVELEYKLSPP